MTLKTKRMFRVMVLLSILFGTFFGAVTTHVGLSPTASALDEIIIEEGEYTCPSSQVPQNCAHAGCVSYGVNGKKCLLYNTVNGVVCNQTIDCVQ